MGREKAFCSNKFMKEALDNPTLFCTVQGVFIHYFTVALALWFVVYSINLLQVCLCCIQRPFICILIALKVQLICNQLISWCPFKTNMLSIVSNTNRSNTELELLSDCLFMK